MRVYISFLAVLASLVTSMAQAQDGTFTREDVICLDTPTSEIYQQHLVQGDFGLVCNVRGTSISMDLNRVSIGRLTAGSVQVVLQGASESEDGRNRAESIELRQIMPRVWDVTHYLDNETPIGMGEHQLIWADDIDLRETRRSFTALAFGAYRVFRCYGDLDAEFPQSIDSCITFYRTAACDRTPRSPIGIDILQGYTAISVRADTRADALLMLSNYSLLNQIATEYAEDIHLLNCGYEDHDTEN